MGPMPLCAGRREQLPAWLGLVMGKAAGKPGAGMDQTSTRAMWMAGRAQP